MVEITTFGLVEMAATVHTIPNTRGGRIFRGVLLVVGISSIVGIADQVRAFLRLALTGPASQSGPVWPERVILLVGWLILCRCAVRAFRMNVLPPAWVAFAMPLLIWAYILWPG